MTTANLPSIYTPHFKHRALRLAGLRAAEAATVAAGLGAGAVSVAAERLHLHRPAESAAVMVDHAIDANNRACSRINELGAVAPSPALLWLYRVLGGERIDSHLAATVENDDPVYPGPMLSPEELDQFEAGEGSVYTDSKPASGPVADRAVTAQYADYDITAADVACWPERDAVEAERVKAAVRAILAGEITVPRADGAAARHYDGTCDCMQPEDVEEGDCPDVILAVAIDQAEAEAYAERYQRDPEAVERDIAARMETLDVRLAALAEMIGVEQ
ncbi:hypothetical protein ACFWNL_18345 [Kitasatospora sp. NPDC058397]|uniref:hypothetical protein n=1 Tax=unclassified Kitasatospora TaxID=2633591 RepID=UPI00364B8C7C